VVEGATELVLVSGIRYRQISVVNECTKRSSRRVAFRVRQVRQYKRDIPLHDLAQAFQTLVRQILARERTEVSPAGGTP